MDVIETKLEGCLIIKPVIHGDNRGFFLETFNADRYSQLAGIKEQFVQDNRSRSSKNVLRGLHFQKKKPQGKLVSVTDGAVFDVAVDLRPNSRTFGEYVSTILSSDNHQQFYIPPGFAHGFIVLSDSADLQYKCTEYYDVNDDGGIIWNDSFVNIDWPIETPLLSEKDSVQPALSDIHESIMNGWK